MSIAEGLLKVVEDLNLILTRSNESLRKKYRHSVNTLAELPEAIDSITTIDATYPFDFNMRLDNATQELPIYTDLYYITPDLHPLPEGYQEVEWIKSNGNAYLNLTVTGQIADSVYFETDFQYTNDTTGESAMLGCTAGFEVFASGSNYSLWSPNSGTVNMSTSFSRNEWHNIKLTLENNKATGTLDNIPFDLNFSYTKSASRVTLFRYREDSESGTKYKYYGYMKFTKLYLGSKQFELIPCYRISDNVVGMYDRIGDVFYTNVGSSGIFTAGPTY